MTVARTVWNRIQLSDYRLMRRVNRWPAPRWFRLFMIVATRLGDGWLWYLTGVVLLLFGGPARFVAFGSAGLAVLGGTALFVVLKRVSHRKRPCEIEPHCWAAILPPDQFSFPSGHSITAFALAFVLGSFYPEFQAPLLVVAASIALSRIILGMHFLSDVLAGSAIGMLIGCTCFHLFAHV
ncbi:MAG TPA: phosphatase PAP2 family protein [Candidatus Acidoferrales bacterium]|nr:phosphatase PAP2 family protein [Candidatus Acidoferrales bacterium]HEV3482237.1 phosphatase PAP2 family protein [Candidatus Acidoferrales bacterium]